MTDPTPFLLAERFAYIPAGVFWMGDTSGDGVPSDLPAHEVFVSPFFLSKYLVTAAEWEHVLGWAVQHGYDFDSEGMSKAGDHPIHSIYWYDAVKWCNARSEMDGLKPVYFTDQARSAVYRAGRLRLAADAVDWETCGYRRPTEAEWEKAARGGLSGRRFPWGDTISYQDANYSSQPSLPYDLETPQSRHPLYAGFTSPVGAFPSNGYGLYDMAGNVLEWCWDNYYAPEASGQDITSGEQEKLYPVRVARGGCWQWGADYARCACRYDAPMQNIYDHIGLRLALSRQPDPVERKMPDDH